MVILGGLEFVVGGYLIHRHCKNKNERKRLEDEARRQDIPPQRPPHHHQQSQPRPIPPKRHPSHPPPGPPQQKDGYHPANPQNRPYMAQPIRRQQSFASLSQMPVANGYQTQQNQPSSQPQPSHAQPHSHYPQAQPRPIQAQAQPRPNYPYYNTGFSASYPSFDPASDQMHNSAQVPGGRYTPQSPHVHFAESEGAGTGAHGALGAERDDDPPPPYQP